MSGLRFMSSPLVLILFSLSPSRGGGGVLLMVRIRIGYFCVFISMDAILANCGNVAKFEMFDADCALESLCDDLKFEFKINFCRS